MKATGIVRRIDDLGRVIIPKEIRRNLHIHENDPLEIFVENDKIIFQPYLPYIEPWRMLEDVAKEVDNNESFSSFKTQILNLAEEMRKSAKTK